jgi:hypothetical protein
MYYIVCSFTFYLFNLSRANDTGARAVNVVYATLFDESPEGLTYCPRGISEDEAAFLQRIAWETVQEYQEK